MCVRAWICRLLLSLSCPLALACVSQERVEQSTSAVSYTSKYWRNNLLGHRKKWCLQVLAEDEERGWGSGLEGPGGEGLGMGKG